MSFEDELCREMVALVTVTRLNNVISKFGRVKKQDIDKQQQIVALLETDLLESFYEEYEGIFNALSPKIRNNMMVELHQASQKLVNNYFK